jgi:hypothetical protein
VATPQHTQQALAWKPHPEGLEKMCALFRDTDQHQKHYQQLQALSTHAEFNVRLASTTQLNSRSDGH